MHALDRSRGASETSRCDGDRRARGASRSRGFHAASRGRPSARGAPRRAPRRCRRAISRTSSARTATSHASLVAVAVASRGSAETPRRRRSRRPVIREDRACLRRTRSAGCRRRGSTRPSRRRLRGRASRRDGARSRGRRRACDRDRAASRRARSRRARARPSRAHERATGAPSRVAAGRLRSPWSAPSRA